MSDITKCTGMFCPVKESCYRFTAKANELWQAYFSVPPFENSTCKMYWGEHSEDIFNQLKDIVNGNSDAQHSGVHKEESAEEERKVEDY